MSNKFPEATITNTEVHMLSSVHVDQTFQIFVALPRHYDPSDTKKTYPILYVLDANGMFGMVTETVRMLQIYYEVPELLIVGIGYPVIDFVETLGLRGRDLTPTASHELRKRMLEISDSLAVPLEYCGAGGAIHFLAFIRQELMLFIHQHYRSDRTDQTLFGDSLGGLFAFYTLFHHPTTFQRYIIGSPGIAWDNSVPFTYETDYAAQHTDLPAKIFMSAGSLEQPMMITNLQTMAQRLQARNYANLELTTCLFDNETHLSVIPATISRGLCTVFG